MTRLRFVAAFAAAVFGGTAGGCDAPSTAMFEPLDPLAVCVDGAERCRCDASASCQAGLVCRSLLCVRDEPTPGFGGSAAAGGLPSGGTSGDSVGGAAVGGGASAASGAGAGGDGPPRGGGPTMAGASAGGSAGQGGTPTEEPVDTGLVVNGDFSQGLAQWVVTAVSGGEARADTSSGALCIEPLQYQTVSVAWPASQDAAFSLRAGVKYELSFEAWAENASINTAKVGHAVPPFWSTFETAVSVGVTPQRYRFTFVASMDDPKGGLVFYWFGRSPKQEDVRRICIDEVTLRPAP